MNLDQRDRDFTKASIIFGPWVSPSITLVTPSAAWQGCDLAPEGWRCMGPKGHEGSCVARPARP